MATFRFGVAVTAAVWVGVLAVTGCSAASAESKGSAAGQSTSLGTESSAGSSDAEKQYAAYLDYMKNYAVSLSTCLAGKGYASEVRPDGGLQTVVPPEQQAAFDAAFKDCGETTGYGASPTLDDETMGLVYDGLLKIRQCLIDRGYTPTEPPTREEWVSTSGATWDVYDGVPQDAVADAQGQCPYA